MGSIGQTDQPARQRKARAQNHHGGIGLGLRHGRDRLQVGLFISRLVKVQHRLERSGHRLVQSHRVNRHLQRVNAMPLPVAGTRPVMVQNGHRQAVKAFVGHQETPSIRNAGHRAIVAIALGLRDEFLNRRLVVNIFADAAARGF